MIAASQVSGKIRRIRLRPIALPAEHGGWGLLFEPIVLGLLLAPSLAGLLLSVAATGAFLARHPFKLAIGAATDTCGTDRTHPIVLRLIGSQSRAGS